MGHELELPEQLSGVGATALGVARLRAKEGLRPDSLVTDPYAEHILAAAAAGGSQWATLSPRPGWPDFFALMADQVAIRTRYLDEVLLRLTHAGCAQVVLLACGMDTRAFRLDWPPGTRLFEIDYGEVLAFRDAALSNHASPRCDRVGVAADLREDWPTELCRAGFDPTQATAWLAEGILYALPPGAADTLLEHITYLSAPNSALALDHVEDSPYLRAARAAMSPDLVTLWQGGPTDLTGWLIERGWQPAIRDLREVAADYHRGVPAELTGTVSDAGRAWLATATLRGGHTR